MLGKKSLGIYLYGKVRNLFRFRKLQTHTKQAALEE